MYSVYELVIDDEVVYVGCSSRPVSRLCQHRTGWRFMDAASVRIVGRYKDKARALAVESHRISQMAPTFNVHWHPECDFTVEGRRARKAAVEAEKERREMFYVDAKNARAKALLADIDQQYLRERTTAGIRNARAQGKQIGAKPKLSPEQRVRLQKDRGAGMSLRKLALKYNVSVGTVDKWSTGPSRTLTRKK